MTNEASFNIYRSRKRALLDKVAPAVNELWDYIDENGLDVEDALRNNRYTDCISWLKEHIQKYGFRYEADEIMKMATGEEFNVNYYLDYLEDKYTMLYHL